MTQTPTFDCGAWALAELDRESKQPLATSLRGHQLEQPRPVGSLTKIMTAHWILRALERRPALLDETVEISERAAGCPGSTAQLRAGERFRLEDLLYALMLPSGNDAAIALAEHLDGEQAFVRAMNHEAAAMGLAHTHYENSHGLDAPGHLSTAGEMLRLTAAALSNPRFRTIVATREHQCESLAGRVTRWQTTNVLLDRPGVCGVKTGRSRTGGACVIALRELDQTSRLVVVLGAPGREQRFTIAAELLDWGQP